MTAPSVPAELSALRSALQGYFWRACSLYNQVTMASTPMPELTLETALAYRAATEAALEAGGDYKLEFARQLFTAVADGVALAEGQTEGARESSLVVLVLQLGVQIGNADELVWLARSGEMDESRAARVAQFRLSEGGKSRTRPVWWDAVLPALAAYSSVPGVDLRLSALGRQAEKWAGTSEGKSFSDLPRTPEGFRKAVKRFLSEGLLVLPR